LPRGSRACSSACTWAGWVSTPARSDSWWGQGSRDSPSARRSSRSWAIHTEAIEKFPDRFALLEKTSKQVFNNPKYKEAYAKTGAPVEGIEYGDRQACNRYVKSIIELANEYRSLLTAKKKG